MSEGKTGYSPEKHASQYCGHLVSRPSFSPVALYNPSSDINFKVLTESAGAFLLSHVAAYFLLSVSTHKAWQQ
jgi:hypothetical protein